MYSAWFYSLYVHSAVQNIQTIHTPDKNAFLNNPVHNLNVLEHTDEGTVPLVSRTPLQNKIILDALMAYQAPRRPHKNVHFDSDSFDICVDTGASSTCTSSRDDFVPGSYVTVEGATINGIASGLTVAGYGTVRWVFHDDNYQPIDVEIDKVLHIPDVPTRLLSPQQLAKQTGGLHDGFHVGASHATLTFGGFKRRINYNSVNKLPIFASFPGVDKFRAYSATLVGDGTASDNLTFNQRQLLHWHRRLSHMNFSTIQKFSRSGLLPKELSKVRPEEYPVCACCQFAKQKKTSIPGPTETSPSIGSSADKPGDVVSVDMIHSPIGGIIPVSKGKTIQDKYQIACVFVDQCTKLVYITYQLGTGAAETVESKHKFEQWAATHGVKIKHYRADNGAFNTRVFKESVASARQTIDFCGVNAHHQNGVVERMIQTLTYRARALLLHAMFHWPDMVTAEFWPFPLRLVVDTHNNSPLPNGLCPIELFAQVKRRSCIKDYHTFGCPAYVLDARLCNGSRVPKWNPRSRRGIYLGMSPEHASNVALIYNPDTGFVSPQYHVVFDDEFTSVKSSPSIDMKTIWSQLFSTNRDMPPDDYKQLQDPHWDIPAESISESSDMAVPTTIPSPNDALQSPDPELLPSEGDLSPAEGVPSTSEGAISPPEGDDITPVPVTGALPSASTRREGETATTHNTPRTRSGRTVVRPNRYRNFAAMTFGLLTSQLQTPITCDKELTLQSVSLFKAEINYLNLLETNADDGSQNLMDPRLLLATDTNNDNLHYGGAMAAPDKKEFIAAMQKEVEALTKDNVWRLEPKRNIPPHAKLIRLIWSFKRKRNPLGDLIKHKARLCVHGGMQTKGVDYWHTYAPVVNWSTVRLVMLLTEMAGWSSRQIDYVLAFSQAPIDTTVYCHLPAGFHIEGGNKDDDYVIVLEKNLYGTKQAAANWFEMLRDNLMKEGFKQSCIDPCLFLREDMIIVTYVDDCLIFSPSKEKIDKLLERLKQTFNLTDEGEDVKAYLGIKVDKGPDGTITMSQPALIQRILTALDLAGENVRMHDTPANTVLFRDEDGAKRIQSWNYRSVIGMLMFVATSTRPDIAFAVHQCAKFNANPKRCHEEAVKRIGRYLKRTLNKGLILRPDQSQQMNCYVDADFAGSFCKQIAHLAASVLSRTGYVITFSGCPILWVSKMQTEIALSTTEAEYIALSQSMRDLIPIRTVLKELATVLGLQIDTPMTHSTVFEDNNGALELAIEPKYRPRTKHIAIKYHHFREHVKNKSIKVKKIDTKEQLADIFTKPIEKHQFEYLRNKLMGW